MFAWKSSIIIIMVAVGYIHCQESARDLLRKALSQDPMSSHIREPKWVPQNMNIVRPFSPSFDLTSQGEMAPASDTMPSPQREQQFVHSNSIAAGRPVTTWRPIAVRLDGNAQSSASDVLNTKPIVNDFGDVQKSQAESFFAPNEPAAPIRQQANAPEMIPNHQRANVQELVPNGQQANVQEMMPNSQQANVPVMVSNPGACPFVISSFLLPDLSISQFEFEQTLLMPAVRAFVLGGPCKSRALNIYLDWLLHLRQRLFNV